jgi:hypothetical protein
MFELFPLIAYFPFPEMSVSWFTNFILKFVSKITGSLDVINISKQCHFYYDFAKLRFENRK